MKREVNSVLISLQRKQAPLWKLSLREHAHGTYRKMKFTVEIFPFGRMLTHRPYLHWIFTHEALQNVSLGDTAGRRRVVRVTAQKRHQKWHYGLAEESQSAPLTPTTAGFLHTASFSSPHSHYLQIYLPSSLLPLFFPHPSIISFLPPSFTFTLCCSSIFLSLPSCSSNSHSALHLGLYQVSLRQQ